MSNAVRQALDEVGAVLDAVDTPSVDEACRRIAAAERIGLYGCGREALQIRGFAMRLFHLGLPVSMVFDVTMPPLGQGDLLIVSAGPGELATVTALMKTAKQAGANVLFLTAVADTPSATLADHVLHLPAQTMASDRGPAASAILPMGSAYEGALFFLFEIMVATLKRDLRVSEEAMRANHTNME
ncbi:SIS domain-containing protein [Oricola cellulosilytica]|uniref:SIS domain-containing protein n=1 Tax=Oricola cellulosilytica TaxID=1429082 RepID=A0A4R0P9N3_9HYPH|nr:SIS domain-containing protein [Oricola cellulosilytica]TCD12432.1 SIS domain-containing protein [Oricola cellulosilytica]